MPTIIFAHLVLYSGAQRGHTRKLSASRTVAYREAPMNASRNPPSSLTGIEKTKSNPDFLRQAGPRQVHAKMALATRFLRFKLNVWCMLEQEFPLFGIISKKQNIFGQYKRSSNDNRKGINIY